MYQDVYQTIRQWKVTGRQEYVCITNPYSVMMCRRDDGMRQATLGGTLVLPDGVGIVLAARMLGRRRKGRVTGPELMLRLCDWGRADSFRHYLLGGAAGVAERLADKLMAAYPGLNIVGTLSPPFRPLTPDEDAELVTRINATCPDLVWVGLGAPKQEKWMAEHLGRVRATAMLGVGAAFDFHSGNVRWAPPWMRRCGLEWVHRLSQDPKRMWRRDLSSAAFLGRVLWQRIRNRGEGIGDRE